MIASFVHQQVFTYLEKQFDLDGLTQNAYIRDVLRIIIDYLHCPPHFLECLHKTELYVF